MTEQEFQKQYHDYVTPSKAAAEHEAALVRAKGVDVQAVPFGDLGYALMLTKAVQELRTLGVLEHL